MEFWIEYVDKSDRRRRKRFDDKSERDYFVENSPSGVVRILKISEDFPTLLPMDLPLAKSITELRSHEPKPVEDSQEYPAQINSNAIERAWSSPRSRLSESFTDPVKAATVLIERFNSGWAISTLAREFHTSRKTIKKLLIDNWIQPRRRRFRNLQDARLDWENAFSKPTPRLFIGLALSWLMVLFVSRKAKLKSTVELACPTRTTFKNYAISSDEGHQQFIRLRLKPLWSDGPCFPGKWLMIWLDGGSSPKRARSTMWPQRLKRE